jgi:putative addiction module component (TIGR02574 family)
MTKENVIEVIDRLPIDYRLLFAEYIMESLSPNDSDIKEAWKYEVQRRMDSVHQGSCALIPSKDLHNDLYRLFKDENTGATQQQTTSEGAGTLQEVIEEIASYNATERIKIRTAIIQTLHGRPDQKIEEAWAKEVQSRLKEAENGEIDLIPGEEVFQKAHKIITQ